MNAKTMMIVALLTGTSAATGDSTAPVPVVAELFTSEGCSSCPPADRLLEILDRQQPVRGALVIALSEHVDYWDRLGWKDPYSSAGSTRRQRTYGQKFRLDSVYTPQMVIDGREQVLGNDAGAVQAAVARAAASPKLQVLVSGAARESGGVIFTVEAPQLPSTSDYARADVWVALAEERVQSDVRSGENSDRRLVHIAVVRKLVKVGEVTRTTGFKQELRLKAGEGASRIIAVVQQQGLGAVAGAGMAKL